MRWPAVFENQLAPAIYTDDSVDHALPTCRPGRAILTGDSIGPFAITATLRDLLGRCTGLKPYWQWMDSGPALPAVGALVGRDLVFATLADTTLNSHVQWIQVRDPVRSVAGIGPGSTIAAAESAYGPGRLAATCDLAFTGLPGVTFQWTLSTSSHFDCRHVRRGQRPPPGTLFMAMLQPRMAPN